METNRPYLWVVDSARAPLASCLDVFSDWADARYFETMPDISEWENDRPDAVFFSAEIDGGADGGAFAALLEQADSITPLLAIAAVRSLAQAVAYFRAGAMDYLSLPLAPEDAQKRYESALEKAERQALSSVVVELEAVDADAGDISLSVAPSAATPLPMADDSDEADDVLAEIPATIPVDISDTSDEEPEAVDGLPIPTLWEELPCGLLVFDSDGNLAFSNQRGLDMFGVESMGELQESLETGRSRYHAYAANHKPLPDNQWPHELARKTKTARSAVVSVEISEKRRQWLRIDCLPHLADGALSRLTMSVINLTGELPPLSLAEPAAQPAKREKARKKTRRSR